MHETRARSSTLARERCLSQPIAHVIILAASVHRHLHPAQRQAPGSLYVKLCTSAMIIAVPREPTHKQMTWGCKENNDAGAVRSATASVTNQPDDSRTWSAGPFLDCAWRRFTCPTTLGTCCKHVQYIVRDVGQRRLSHVTMHPQHSADSGRMGPGQVPDAGQCDSGVGNTRPPRPWQHRQANHGSCAKVKV